MTQMTPRERSELVRRQSRDYIAALRKDRLQRVGKPASAPAQPRDKTPSAFRPSPQASARASEARARPLQAPPRSAEARIEPATAGPAPREEAAAVRQASAASLSQLRDARRSRQPGAERVKPGRAAPPAASGRPSRAAIEQTLVPPTIAQPVTAAAVAAGPEGPCASPESVPAGTGAAPQRRTRPKRGPSTERAGVASSDRGGARDIDVISGLGPALKSKLRHSGIATVEVLSAQKPERLREILGPAGRLVNLDALVRAAKAACGGAMSGPASAGGARPPSKSTLPRRGDA